jgi:multidrug efflux system outer membrane protein
MNRLVRMASVLAWLAGCSLAPELKQPELDVPARYKELPAAARGAWKTAQPAEGVARGQWWKVFNDPVLDQLEDDATAANQNLQAAAARVAQARSLVGVAKAERIPQVSAGFGPSRIQPTGVSLGLPPGEFVDPYTAWRALVTVSYEVDLFGRVSDTVDATRSDYESNIATFRSVILALQADVAQTYFALRATDDELRILRETVGWRDESVRLLQKRFELGDISELDLARAKTEASNARTEAIGLERRRGELEHALAVLLGKPPAALAIEVAPLGDDLPAIPAGLPSELLERRPDIAAASRSMAAANSRIGVAKSAFFPVLRLTAAGGFESADLADLFNWSSRTWLLGPLIGTLLTAPIIDGGRNRANLERAEAGLQESIAVYRQQVLVAFAEVENSLIAVRTLDGQAQSTRDSLVSAARAAKIADVRYKAGATSYLDVIEAQRTLLTVQRLDTQIRGSRANSTVALIRALGGGWDTPAMLSDSGKAQ